MSPVLANIYLHFVLDLWFEKHVEKHCSGKIFFVRYADDFVCLFKNEKDAENFYKVLPERMALFNLKLAPDKTQIVTFKGKLRIPRKFATDSTGSLPSIPAEGCHLIHGKTATCRSGATLVF